MANNLSKILNNKYFFYFILFLAGSNLLGYIAMGNINAVVFFILVAFLSMQFTDNKVIALLIAIVLSNLFLSGKKVKEGMASKSDEEDEKKKNSSVMDGPVDESSNSDSSSSDSTNNNSDNNPTTIASSSSTTPPESMNTMSNKKRTRIDYASTVEQAYDNLHQILGGEGIKNLTQDTQKLMGQQQQLAEAMKSMTPLLETAKTMLDGFDMKNLNGLAEFAKNFSATK